MFQIKKTVGDTRSNLKKQSQHGILMKNIPESIPSISSFNSDKNNTNKMLKSSICFFLLNPSDKALIKIV